MCVSPALQKTVQENEKRNGAAGVRLRAFRRERILTGGPAVLPEGREVSSVPHGRDVDGLTSAVVIGQALAGSGHAALAASVLRAVGAFDPVGAHGTLGELGCVDVTSTVDAMNVGSVGGCLAGGVGRERLALALRQLLLALHGSHPKLHLTSIRGPTAARKGAGNTTVSKLREWRVCESWIISITYRTAEADGFQSVSEVIFWRHG